MSSTRRYMTILALALLPIAGCGATRGGSDAGAQPAPARGVPVAVSNYNWLDVDIYALRSGIRHRLGTVGTGQTVLLTVPPGLVDAGQVRLLVDPIGGRPFLTDPILVAPGQQIELRVENHLPLSNWMVH
ncbi:MAG TPA: hypothetical protein VF188_18540 [Longimicrobiales bacterium]